jgi:hypothetical protein
VVWKVTTLAGRSDLWDGRVSTQSPSGQFLLKNSSAIKGVQKEKVARVSHNNILKEGSISKKIFEFIQNIKSMQGKKNKKEENKDTLNPNKIMERKNRE